MELGKYIGLFAKGIGLGLGIGLCLAGAAALLFRVVHGGGEGASRGHADLYFFVVGAFLGILGGWGFSLQMILDNLLSALFLKVSELVPMPAQVAGEEWARKMEAFFREIIEPFPALFRRFVEFFLVARFGNVDRINQALDKARRKEPVEGLTARRMSLVVLHYFLEPLWIFFYAAYAMLLLAACVFWALAFLK